ncbi:MAG: hypothetical protein QF903_00730 [Planctomycetota bacterium]|nr:hypothetical protein [Planctomycetota bacterium]MDP6761619.1 hypothetical protein [Planctomycetota bacterium]MDP6987985.1 hypothetical protein [Planctomycetota bacterium]
MRCVRDVDDCTRSVASCCTPKTTSSGCTPTIGAAGTPSAGAGSGFTVTAEQVERNQFGILFYHLRLRPHRRRDLHRLPSSRV